jgi:hypothetical protein
VIGTTEGIVGGILTQGAGEIRLRTEITGSGEGIESKILAFCAFQGIIPLVADKGETGTTDDGGQGKQTEFGGRKV